MDTAFSETPGTAHGRAKPLPADDRRAMIIGAVIPLMLEHGASLTTRQIAEGVGIAEGTIFRAFGDKETLLKAAAEAYFDPEPLNRALRAIDRDLSLEDTTAAIIGSVRDRLSGVFRMIAAVGGIRPTPGHRDQDAFVRLIGEVLEPHAARLAWSAERVGHAIRLVTFAASIPEFSSGTEFSTRELTALLLNGVTTPPPSSSSKD